MIDRSLPPPTQTLFEIGLPPCEYVELDNGVPVCLVNLGTQPVLRIEVIFKASRPYEHKQMVAAATARLLREGTALHTSEEISRIVDYFGASLNTPFGLDVNRVVIHCLTRFVPDVLPVLGEMVSQPSFPEDELKTFIKTNRERLKINLKKTDFVAYRRLTEHIFGTDHPYGYNSSAEAYENLVLEDITRHFQESYLSGNCLITVSGKPDLRTLPLLNNYLGSQIQIGIKDPVLPNPNAAPPRREYIKQAGARQTAIRIGRKMFSRKHPDFHGMEILTHLLGGYFGSRLMANLREEKGLTYNVQASLDTYIHDGYLYVGAEVGNAKVDLAISEIYREMDRLRDEPVGEEELQMLRTYMQGSILNLIDGPFSVSDVHKWLNIEGLGADFFDKFIYTVRHITPQDLQALACKYLRREDFWEVIVGP
jgi:zinc protease